MCRHLVDVTASCHPPRINHHRVSRRLAVRCHPAGLISNQKSQKASDGFPSHGHTGTDRHFDRSSNVFDTCNTALIIQLAYGGRLLRCCSGGICREPQKPSETLIPQKVCPDFRLSEFPDRRPHDACVGIDVPVRSRWPHYTGISTHEASGCLGTLVQTASCEFPGYRVTVCQIRPVLRTIH